MFIPSSFRRTRKACDCYWKSCKCLPTHLCHVPESWWFMCVWSKVRQRSLSPQGRGYTLEGRGYTLEGRGYTLERPLPLQGSVDTCRDVSGSSTVNMVTIENIVTQYFYYTQVKKCNTQITTVMNYRTLAFQWINIQHQRHQYSL